MDSISGSVDISVCRAEFTSADELLTQSPCLQTNIYVTSYCGAGQWRADFPPSAANSAWRY